MIAKSFTDINTKRMILFARHSFFFIRSRNTPKHNEISIGTLVFIFVVPYAVCLPDSDIIHLSANLAVGTTFACFGIWVMSDG